MLTLVSSTMLIIKGVVPGTGWVGDATLPCPSLVICRATL